MAASATNLVQNPASLPGVDQSHRTAPETSSGHATAEHSVDLPRELDDLVELSAGHLKVVHERHVAAVHALAGGTPVPRFQCRHEGEGPRMLGDNVPRAAAFDVGQ